MTLDDRKHQMLVDMFGEPLASEIIQGAEDKSKELEGHVAFKESEEHTQLKASIEAMGDGELKTALTAAIEAHPPAQKGEEEDGSDDDADKDKGESNTDTNTEAFKEAFGLMSKAINILSENGETLTKGLGELVTRLDSVDTQLAELKKSDDEKIATQFIARRGDPASQSAANVLSKEAIAALTAAGEGKGEGEGANGGGDAHARPYVEDLINRGAAVLPQGGSGS